MRFLHIADLHLGKQMNDVSLLPDQEYVLQQIISIASSEQADAVLIAGDVYQRSSPQAEAMALFDSFVSRLAELGKQVFIISGNHDSALRVSYFSSLVKSSGVYVTRAGSLFTAHVLSTGVKIRNRRHGFRNISHSIWNGKSSIFPEKIQGTGSMSCGSGDSNRNLFTGSLRQSS